MTRLLVVEILAEHDVVVARQRARQVAGIFGFDAQDQARVSSAVSELARNAFQHAGGGRLEFYLQDDAPRSLRVVVRDSGPGLEGISARPGPVGGGQGLASARRLMDRFEVESERGVGTTVRVAKDLPSRAAMPTIAEVVRQVEELSTRPAAGPFEEVQRQNQDLMQALAQLRAQQAVAEKLVADLEASNRELALRGDELARIYRELEETNRGVLALNKELDERALAVQQASEAKGRFFSHMSHEFRTPLNSIRSLARFLLEPDDGPLPPEKARQAGYIARAADSLAEMVNDLLDLAKIEAGKLEVRVDSFAVADLFGALRGIFRPMIDPGSAVALVFETRDAPATLRTDEGKVGQILRNLVSNALKFTERGEVRVSARALPEGLVAFDVADTGIGIAPEDRARVFEEFAQVSGPLQARQKGTGLGLSLSKTLAELLGGRIDLESEAGRGSTFSAILPAAFATPGGPAPAAAPPTRPTALIVDDDEISRYLLRDYLGGASDLEVVEASGGVEGLRLAAGVRPAAIFLDLNMPGMDGFEVFARLKADPATREIPVIIHSSMRLKPTDRARLGEAAAFVIKGGEERGRCLEEIRSALALAGLGPGCEGSAVPLA